MYFQITQNNFFEFTQKQIFSCKKKKMSQNNHTIDVFDFYMELPIVLRTYFDSSEDCRFKYSTARKNDNKRTCLGSLILILLKCSSQKALSVCH